MERRTHSEHRAPCGRTEGRMDRRTQGWCPWGWPGLGLQPLVPPGTLLLQDGSGSKGMCLQRGCCGRSCAEPDEFSPEHAMKKSHNEPAGTAAPQARCLAAGTCTQPPSSPAATSGSPGLGQALTLPRESPAGGGKAAAIRGILMAGRHGGAVPNSHGHNKDSTGRGVRICAERKKKKKVLSP